MKKLNVMQVAVISMVESPLVLVAMLFIAVIGGVFYIKRKINGDL